MLLLSIGLLIILLGFLVRTRYIDLPMYASIFRKKESGNGRLVSVAFLWIGFILLFFGLLSFLNEILGTEIIFMLNILGFATLIITIVFFIIKLNPSKSHYEKYLWISCGLAAFVLLLISIQQPSIIIKKNNLQIKAIFSYECKISDIDSIWVDNKKLSIDKKLSGFNFQNFYRGKFKIKNSDQIYRLYINDTFHPYLYIVLKNNEIIVFDNSDFDETKSVLHLLKRKIKN